MDLADRMKQYEAAFDTRLPTSSPIILHLNGHNFSRFTPQLDSRQPFDQHIHDAFVSTCHYLLIDYFPRATIAYTYSDKIILVFPKGGVQFCDEHIQKLASLAAAYCSVRFNEYLGASPAKLNRRTLDGWAHFEARVFTVPNIEEALSYLIWRCCEDARGNSIRAFARTMFSQGQVDGKTSAQLIEMMRQEKDVVYEEAVPEWAIDGCLVKPELQHYEFEGPTTDQVDTEIEMGASVAYGGFKEASAKNLRLVTERYWNDFGTSQLPKSIVPVAADNSSITTANATFLGPNVYVFDPRMPAADIQAKVTAIFKQMEANEFSNERYALLFKPGTYNVLFDVGFYTQVAGLGQNPDDVLIEGGANVPAYWMPNRNATCNFWRSFENFSINASQETNNTTTIAVSQAAPLRRMHIRSSGGLWLFQVDPATGAGGWASGGFMADSIVDGQVLPGSQQQWLSRNNKYGSWANAVWNMVFVGDSNAPSQDNFPVSPYTTVDHTPLIREKPYLYMNSLSQYEVFVPALKTNTQGPSWADGSSTPGHSIPIDKFYITQPSTSNAALINLALDSGKHILLTPGIYKLDDALRISRADTIILGLGMPSLIPMTGQPALTIADVDGVTIAGLIIDASEVNSPSLVEVGPPNSSANHASNPTFLYDLTVRTAGCTENDVGIVINSNNVVGDQLWLWRADHGDGAAWDANPTRNGIVVNGDNVTIYGLFNEHHKEHQTLWNGNGGRLYFYQSEIPYDPPDQKSWMGRNRKGVMNGFPSYKVADSVTSHEAWGLGIYSYFRDSPTKLENAIEVPEVEGVKLHHMTTVWLTGTPGSEITHIVNGVGGRVYANTPESAMRQTLNEFSGGDSR
ncbi:glycoside hydrolase family 55 protein [Hypomontagnella monticulosa]|nr:glycoside hydrolase family 55 protein [Hypomontagnella monticulosa]